MHVQLLYIVYSMQARQLRGEHALSGMPRTAQRFLAGTRKPRAPVPAQLWIVSKQAGEGSY